MMTTNERFPGEVFDQAQVGRFRAELEAESDRGIILVSIAVLDEIVTEKLRKVLSKGNTRSLSRLLDPPMGSVSGFMSKVDLCFCLGIIPQRIYGDIRGLNRLRNNCAHNWNRFHLTDDIVNQYIEPMAVKKVLDAAFHRNPAYFWGDGTARTIAAMTLASLIAMVNLLPFHPPPTADEQEPPKESV